MNDLKFMEIKDHTTDVFVTNLRIDTSTNYRELNLSQTPAERAFEEGAGCTLIVEMSDGEITINDVCLSGVMKDLFLQFINLKQDEQH